MTIPRWALLSIPVLASPVLLALALAVLDARQGYPTQSPAGPGAGFAAVMWVVVLLPLLALPTAWPPAPGRLAVLGGSWLAVYASWFAITRWFGNGVNLLGWALHQLGLV